MSSPKPFIHTFSFELTEKQYKTIAKHFKACRLGEAAMLAQPHIWFGGASHIRSYPPIMKVTVVNKCIYEKLQAVLSEAHTGKKL